jgi:hypothetical protein
MEPILFRIAATVVALGCGAVTAQVIDSTSLRRDSLTVPPSVVAVAPTIIVQDSVHKDSLVVVAKPDTTVVVKPDTATAMPVKPDTSIKVTPPIMAAGASQQCDRKPVWSLEGTVRYGWRGGDLLDEEDRLARQFKVVLVDKNDDTSNVNPIASGFGYQAALWFKGCCGNQFGAGIEYAMLMEHPASTYSMDLTESFLEQILATVRFRKGKTISDRFNLFYEVAGGYSRTTIHGIPLVYANQNESRIRLTASDRSVITLLHKSTAANGIHVEAGFGSEYRISQNVGVALKAGLSADKMWREEAVTATSGATSASNAQDVSTFGFDLGLSASRDF